MQHPAEHPPQPPDAPHEALARAWQALRESAPKLRIRDAAARLGVSEAELRASECGGAVTRLCDDWPEILRRLPLCGEVMALTRNESAVHEKVGEYKNLRFEGAHTLVLGEAIDLRIFLKQWAHGFAALEDGRRSLHFFDAHGDAVHKIYAREGTDTAELEKLVELFRADDQSQRLTVTPRPEKAAPRPDEEIDAPALQAAWEAMRDTHEFFGLLRRHKVTRVQAMRLAPAGRTRKVAVDSLDHALARAAAEGLGIMVFVGNPGCIQIHTGPVARIVPMGQEWINVLDPGFNLHLRRDHVAEAWTVEKPTEDGVVSSLELFDARGETIALVFGARKPGLPELPGWRALLAGLESFTETTEERT